MLEHILKLSSYYIDLISCIIHMWHVIYVIVENIQKYYNKI